MKPRPNLRFTQKQLHDSCLQANREGYEEGFLAGGKQMEEAKLGGILDLQMQLDEARRQIRLLQAFRKSIANILMEELR